LPYQVGYFTHSDAKYRLRAIVAEEKPDLLFFQLVRTAEYARELKVPSLLDYMDAFSCGMAQRAAVGGWWARWAHALEHRLLQRYERRVFDRFSAHTVISDRDCGALPLDRRQGVVVVPNGVDTDVFSPRREASCWDLQFVGNMAYPPNVRAAHTLVRDIFPKIRHHRPSVRLLIAGANPTASVRRLASDGVEISGWVEDITECYAKSRIFVAPMELGTGMQNKLLQAMAMGLPCVTTPLAAEALALPEGVMRILDLETMDRAVIELLDRPEEAERLGREGHEVVVERFRWESTTNALEMALSRAVDRGRFDG
jgi:glycosyltransferase involved in cell wall biosynthesis